MNAQPLQRHTAHQKTHRQGDFIPFQCMPNASKRPTARHPARPGLPWLPTVLPVDTRRASGEPHEHPARPQQPRQREAMFCHFQRGLRKPPKGAHHQHQRGVGDGVERGAGMDRGDRRGRGTQGEESQGSVARGVGRCVCSRARLAPG